MRIPALLAAAALLCAGCSAAEPDDDARKASATPDAYRTAVLRAGRAVAKGSAHIDEHIDITGDGTTYTLTLDGDFDFAADRGSIAVDFPGGAVDHVEEVFAEDTVYVHGIEGAQDGSWGAADRAAAESHYVLRAPLNDPAHVLRQVSAMREVSKMGTETVGGRRAVHYRGVLGQAAVVLRMADDVRKKLESAGDALGGDVPVFVDAWVDGQGRLVRTRMTLNMSGSGVTTTLDLSDFGEKVRPKVPDRGDTFPVSRATGVLLG